MEIMVKNVTPGTNFSPNTATFPSYYFSKCSMFIHTLFEEGTMGPLQVTGTQGQGLMRPRENDRRELWTNASE